MEVTVWTQHTKATKKGRTYVGRLEGIRVTLELPAEYFKEPAPAEVEVTIKTNDH